MKSKKILIALLTVAIIAGAAGAAYLYLRPRTEPVDLHMYGVMLSRSGEAVAQVELDLTGEKRTPRGGDEGVGLDLRIAFPPDSYAPFINAKTEGSMFTVDYPGYYVTSFWGYDPSGNSLHGYDLGLSADFDSCIIKARGDQSFGYILACASPEPEIDEIWDNFPGFDSL